MNLLCPNCQKMLQVLDQFAGQMMKCPMCGGAFTVPGLQTNPSSSAPAAAPPSGAAAAAPFPDGAASPAAGYQHVHSLTLRPGVVTWLAPVSQVLILVLLFFSWIQSGIGQVDSNDVVIIPTFSGWQTAFGDNSSGLGTLFVLLYLLTLITALATVISPLAPPESLPPPVRSLLPWMQALIALGAGLCLLLLVIQIITTFGPENQKPVFEDLRANLRLYNSYSHTFWLRLVVLCEVVSVIGGSLATWSSLRGKQYPPPRIDVTW